MDKVAKTNTGLVAYSKAQVGLPYWYGTFGQTATASLYNSKKAMYPSYYTARNFASQYGKRVHDCVGLIKGYIWSSSTTATPKYNAAQDKSAAGMYSASKLKGKISSFPKKAGQLVYKGATAAKITHVGVYDGNGYVYEAKGHAYGVVKTVFKASEWPYWSQCPYITDDTSSGTSNKTNDTLEGLNMTEAQLNARIDQRAEAKAKTIANEKIKEYFSNLEKGKQSAYADKAWKEAKEKGFLDGTMPLSYVQRQQLAEVGRKTGIMDLSTEKEVSDWAKKFWEMAIDLGITDGTKPRAAATRQEVIIMILKAIDALEIPGIEIEV